MTVRHINEHNFIPIVSGYLQYLLNLKKNLEWPVLNPFILFEMCLDAYIYKKSLSILILPIDRNWPPKFFHGVILNFSQMDNSQAISIKLEATVHTDSLNIIEVCSCYFDDKTMNITVVILKFIFKFCCHGNMLVGLNMPFS